MDSRRNEIIIGQSVNLANAACLNSETYKRATSVEEKKEIMLKAIDFYYDVIIAANENHKVEDTGYRKPYNNGGYKKQYNNNGYNKSNANYAPSDPNATASAGQVKWVKDIIQKNPNVPMTEAQEVSQAIDGNTLLKSSATQFINKYK